MDAPTPLRAKTPNLLKALGPGLVTGAADDDPSGIATYSRVGAQFGYTLGWTMLFSYPLMTAVQGLSAGIGAVSGKGLAKNLKFYYHPWLAYAAMALLFAANFINIGADLAAMGAAVRLLVGGPEVAYALLFGILCATIQVIVPYPAYVSVLKWLTLSLFAYVAVVLVAGVAWGEALRAILMPTVAFSGDHFTAIVAILGTTISPYLFFWQAGEEVEELRRRKLARLRRNPDEAAPELGRIRMDTLVGMGFSNVVALCIVVAAAATLHVNGIEKIETSAQAAEALKPVAGEFAFAVFAVGMIGTGLLAVPVLAGSAAYAVAESFGWPEGLDKKLREAKAFYATIVVATVASVAVIMLGFDPMRALYWSAVVNGVLATPIIILMVMMARNPAIMGGLKAPRWMIFICGFTAIVMGLSTIGMFVS
ncbi:divalent metal cation transporter (plasmid) [Rhizobium sp. Pop5]|uniref:NRAMP family divalent metal transporter n=1 Tax=Rhizobium sp. Pop5 TaxID=1223565 RepID=UPI000283C445|nr:divalent metal cation transporter [Rhizobium sp. Pop5]EJZ18471.1 natural resistance-associated macrophage protein [Rhizobium sp. Pop5]UVD60315.1 divalent metal cation transporter [Rhizobium sp. Pop5]